MLKNYLSEPLFSELLGSTVFIWPRAVGTRGTPGAALRREVGAGAQGTCAGPGAALSQEVGTGAAGHAVPPELPCAALVLLYAGRWEPEPRGHAAAPELPCAGTRGAPGAALHREVGATPGAAPSRSIVDCF
jgi:hypothetical protein